LLSTPFKPSSSYEWRTFYFVDPSAEYAPVTNEPYILASQDGSILLVHSDLRGEASVERLPAGDYVIKPALRAVDF
jgi:hypothetical protein